MGTRDIENKITSEDIEVLLLCNKSLDKLLDDEETRRYRAEDKAQNLLPIYGVGATLLTGLGGLIYKYDQVLLVEAALPIIALIILLVKGA